MPPVYLKGIGVVNIPDGATPDQRQQILLQAIEASGYQTPLPARPEVPSPGLLARGKNLAQATLAGAIEGVGAIPTGLGGVTGIRTLEDLGNLIENNSLASAVRERPEDAGMEWTGGKVLGNLATMVAPGGIARGVGAAPGLARALSAGMGMAQGAAEQVREARQNRAEGMTVTPDEEQRAAQLGSLTGLLDLLPAERLTRFLRPAVTSKGMTAVRELAKTSTGDLLRGIGATAATEAATEAAQQAAQNLIEQRLYNPQQTLGEGVGESALVGGLAGGGLDALVSGLARRSARKIEARAERVKAEGPVIPKDTDEAIGIRRGAKGEPDISYIEAVAQAGTGKPFSELPAEAQKTITQKVDELKSMGVSRQEAVDLFREPEVPAAAPVPTEPIVSLDEGRIQPVAKPTFQEAQRQKYQPPPEPVPLDTLTEGVPEPAPPVDVLNRVVRDQTIQEQAPPVTAPEPVRAVANPVMPTRRTPAPVAPAEVPSVADMRAEVEAGRKPELALDLYGEMRRLGVDDLVSTRLVDSITNPRARGHYLDRIVTLSLDGSNPQKLKQTLNHEAVHAMYAMGLFTKPEWALLRSTMTPSATLTPQEYETYRQAYGDDVDAIHEEAIARGIERYISGDLELPQDVRSVVGQKVGALDRMGSLFRSKGLDTPTKVLDAFQSGAIGNRQLSQEAIDDIALSDAERSQPGAGQPQESVPEEAARVARQENPEAAEAPARGEVDPYDIASWLGDTDEEGQVPTRAAERMAIEQEPVNNPIFAPPDARGELRRQAEEAVAKRKPGELGGPGLRARTEALDARAPIEALAEEAGNRTQARTSSIEAVRRADTAADLSAAALKHGALRYVGTPGNGYFETGATRAPWGEQGFFTEAYKGGKLDRLMHYLAAERGESLMAEGREKLLTPQQIKEFKQFGQDPTIQKAAAEWRKFNDGMIDALEASGRIDGQMAAKLKATTYLPFYRVEESNGRVTAQSSGGSRLSSNPRFTKLKGSSRQVADYMENIVRNVDTLTAMATKNEAMQRVMRDGLKLGYVKQAAPDAKDTVTVYVKGKPKKFDVTDPLLYKSVTFSRTPATTWMKIAGLPAQFLRSSVTLAPPFWIRNLIRDSIMVSAQGYSNVPFASAMRGAYDAVTESPAYLDMERMGIVGSGIRGEGGAPGTAENLRFITDPSLMNVTQRVMHAVENFSRKSEAANRLVVYDKVLKDTGDPAQAAMEARELLNFNRRGASAIAQTLSALIPFQNARFQGADVLYRTAVGRGANKEMQKQLIQRTALIGSASMIYAVLASQTEAWKNATEEERDGYWFVPLPGTDQTFRVPIPFELGYVAKVVPERLVATMQGQEDGRVFLRSFARFLTDTMKVDVLPQALRPAAEVVANYDTFRGKPVESPWLERYEKTDRYDERTSDLAKILSGYTGQAGDAKLSPVQIDHLIRGYAGTSGMYFANLADYLISGQAPDVVGDLSTRKLSEQPVVGTLFQRPDGARALVDYYESRMLAERAAASLKQRLKSGVEISASEQERLSRGAAREKATDAADKAISNLTRVERQIRHDQKAGTILPAAAREALREIRSRKLEIAGRGKENAERIQ